MATSLGVSLPRIRCPWSNLQLRKFVTPPSTVYKRKVPSFYAVAAEMSTPRGSCNQAISPASDAQCSRCREHTVGRIDRRAKDELQDTWYHFIAEIWIIFIIVTAT